MSFLPGTWQLIDSGRQLQTKFDEHPVNKEVTGEYMPRRRRRIISNSCYEFCFRAKQGLPLSAHRIVRELIGASVARAQRDEKVILCHDIWNGSHPHLIAVTRDAAQATNFLAEVEKKLTDSLKRLLGLSHMEIWEGRPMMARIHDVEAAKNRIVYLYSNPAQDDLESSIEKFPGYSSWNEFQRSLDNLKAVTKESFPWIRLPSIPQVSHGISTEEDARVVRLLRLKNEKRHVLERSPNAWMKCFGICADEEVSRINASIVSQIREQERQEVLRRRVERKNIVGASQLRKQPLMKPHVPQKRERKVFVMSSDAEARIAEIEDFDNFCRRCEECYRHWKRGEICVEWPAGAFRPPIPPNSNLLAAEYY